MIPLPLIDLAPLAKADDGFSPEGEDVMSGAEFMDILVLMKATVLEKVAVAEPRLTTAEVEELPQSNVVQLSPAAPSDEGIDIAIPAQGEAASVAQPIGTALASLPVTTPAKEVVAKTATPVIVPELMQPMDWQRRDVSKPTVHHQKQRMVTTAQSALESKIAPVGDARLPLTPVLPNRDDVPARADPASVTLPLAARRVPVVMSAKDSVDSRAPVATGVESETWLPRERNDRRARPSSIVPTPAMPALQTAAMMPAAPTMVPGMPVPTPLSELQQQSRVELVTDNAPPPLVEERLSAVMRTTTASPIGNGAGIAREVANQMALAVSTQSGGATEIALSPKELGRVRLAMTAVDSSITLTVLAERPETTDLMRRHIDVLAQEFKSLGYDDISFSFAGDDQQSPDADASEESNHDSPVENDVSADLPPIHPAAIQSGLDLRL